MKRRSVFRRAPGDFSGFVPTTEREPYRGLLLSGVKSVGLLTSHYVDSLPHPQRGERVWHGGPSSLSNATFERPCALYELSIDTSEEPLYTHHYKVKTHRSKHSQGVLPAPLSHRHRLLATTTSRSQESAHSTKGVIQWRHGLKK